MLRAKVKAVERLLGRAVDRVVPCPCGDFGYRMKASFRVRTLGHKRFSFAWHDPEKKELTVLEGGFPIATDAINNAMPVVLDALGEFPALSNDVFEAKFLTTLSGEMMLTLMHRKALEEEEWHDRAEILRTRLKEALGMDVVSIVGRARKQHLQLGPSHLVEKFRVKHDGTEHNFVYRQSAEDFTQPNGLVNQEMLQWAANVTKPGNDGGMANDLLEIYCGNGNFTAVLAKLNYDFTLASENVRNSVMDAQWALSKNNIRNAVVVRLSSGEMAQALFQERQFERLREVELNDFDFRTIFVDPPRQGLDSGSLRLLCAHIGQIVYVSCNPMSLKRDLDAISNNSLYKMEITDLTCFDQFPSTDHVEIGVVIEMRER